MSSSTESTPHDPPAARHPDRPEVLDLVTGPEGRSFRLRFRPHQSLPLHHNPERVVIVTEAGTGILEVESAEPRSLASGVVVQLEPRTPHAVTAGDDGLELTVTVAPSCCRMC